MRACRGSSRGRWSWVWLVVLLVVAGQGPLGSTAATPSRQDAGDGRGEIVVHKRVCPEGIDPAAMAEPDRAAACALPGANIVFALAGNGEERAETTALDPATADDWRIRWDEVAPGVVTIREQIPAGYGVPLVYCGDLIVRAEGGMVTLEVARGQQIDCLWYNLAAGDDAPAATAAAEEPLPSGVAAVAGLCAPGGSVHGMEIEELLAACVEPAPGTVFTLQAGQAGGEERSAEAAQISLEETEVWGVAWEEIAPGTLTIIAALPATIADVAVACASQPQLGRGTGYDVVTDINGTITRELAAGERLTCRWFLEPYWDHAESETGRESPPDDGEPGADEVTFYPRVEVATPAAVAVGVVGEPGGEILEGDDERPTGADPGSVTIFKRGCAAGVDAGATLDTLIGSCFGDGEGFVFHLRTADGQDLVQRTIPASGGLGGWRADWPEVASGTVIITEEVLEGFDAPLIFCDGGSGFEPVASRDGASVTEELAAGGVLVCWWFNVAAGRAVEEPAVEEPTREEPTVEATAAVEDEPTRTEEEDEESGGDEVIVPTDGTEPEEDEEGDAEPPAEPEDAAEPGEEAEPREEAEETETAVADETLPETTSLTLRLWDCPVGTTIDPETEGVVAIAMLPTPTPLPAGEEAEGEAAARQAFLDACGDRGEGTFHLQSETADEERTTTRGEVVWEELTPGRLAIAQQDPAAEEVTSVVFCGEPPARVAMEAGVMVYEVVAAEGAAACDWFNLPATGTIVLGARDCPRGFDASALSAVEAFEACPTPLDGATFEVSLEEASEPIVVATGESSESGSATVEGVPAGPVRIVGIPNGVSLPPVVFCAALFPPITELNPGSLEPVALDPDGGVTLDLTGAQVFFCTWFIALEEKV